MDELTTSISASGDRSIRVWCIHSGSHLATYEAAHPRGIASLDFVPIPPKCRSDGMVIKGYIVSGSSDASVRLSTLVTVPVTHELAQAGQGSGSLVNPMEGLSFRDMMISGAGVDIDMSASDPQDRAGSNVTVDISPPSFPSSPVVKIIEGPICWTDCLCPPAIRKPDSTHCMRCWNRGHTALVRSLCLRGDIIVSGGYDGTAKVSASSSLPSPRSRAMLILGLG